MVALTDNANRAEQDGKLILMPVKSTFEIFRGALLVVTTNGFVRPAAAIAGAVYAGMAYEAQEAVAVDGDASVRVERFRAIEIDGAGFVEDDLMKAVYASDDNTVSTTQGLNEVKVGIIIKVISATKVLVAQDTNVAKV